MKVKVIKVWEYKQTSGVSSRTGKEFNSTMQNFTAEVNGAKARFTAFGREDLTHLQGQTVDIKGYEEQDEYQGTPQYKISHKTTITGFSVPSQDLFEDAPTQPQPTMPKSNIETKLDKVMNQTPDFSKAERFVELYLKISQSLKSAEIKPSSEDIRAAAISIMISEYK